MGSSKKVTVGYRYYMGLHFGICHGPADSVHEVLVGERSAWIGSQTTSGSIGILAGELFGGDKREGGVEGVLDVMMGEPAQGANTYLATKLGAGIPAFRGILSAVWQGGLVTSNNPYVKPWAFRVKRILQGWSGGSAWYPEKAEIPNGCTLGSTSTRIINVDDDFDYLVVNATDNTNYSSGDFGGLESTGSGPFGNDVHPSDDEGFPAPNTIVASSPLKKIWIKSTFSASLGDTLNFRIKHDNDINLWLNGVPISTTGYSSWVSEALNVSAAGGTNTVVLRITDTGPDAAGNYVYAGMIADRIVHADTSDMNPAHIVYHCLTDSAWGMGYPTGAIDNTSFVDAADTLYSEGFGLSLLWNRQESIEEFMKIVLDHIGAMLYVKPDTGTFALKLIRSDYDRGSLPMYGPETLVSVEDYQRQAWGETINEITVVYTDKCSGKEVSTTVQDVANIQTQGGVVAQTRNYSGIGRADLANRVAQRDLNAASTPLARIKLTATRAAWAVFPGDVFRLTWPEFGIDDVVYRALSVNRGTLTDGQIIIDAVEDVFGLPDNTYLVEQPGEWEDPSNPPAVAPHRSLIEAPYWDLVRNLSEADMAYVDSLSGYLETLAVRPSNDALNYSIYARTGAADYTLRGSGNFCPTATIVGALTKTTTSITLENGIDLDIVSSGGYAVIDSEYVLVSAINWIAGTATISRGVLDTLPATHSAGARIWFADGWQGYDATEAADGETVDVKLLPVTGQGELALAAATVDSITFDQRQYRPYAPGKLLINNSAYPEWIDGQSELSLTWAHRDRLTQTAYIVEQNEASIGPEAGVTYTLKIYGETDALMRTVSGISTSSYTYAAANELSDGGGLVEDTHWSNVKTLLNMNGADGSTSFIDSASAPITWTASGNAHIETDQYKFGGSSAYFDGASDYLYGPASNAAFNLGSDDFSIDLWIMRKSGGAAGQAIIGVWGNTINTTSWIFWVTSDGKLCFSYSTNGSYDPTRSKQSSSGAVGLDVWSFIEWSRSGTTMRLFVDGVIVLTHTCGTDNIYFTATVPKIGSDDSGDHLSAFIEDLRLTKGSCRNTTAYTPPIYQAAHYMGDARLNGRLRVELESVRGGLVSYQKYDHTVLREGYGFNYGYYYGGQ